MVDKVGMSEHQIYKWFWEMNNKSLNVANETIHAIKENPQIKTQQLDDWAKFEIFAKKALKQNKHSPALSGHFGNGQPLDKHDILSALKVHWQASKQIEDYDELSLLMGQDTHRDAMVLLESNDAMRITIPIFRPKLVRQASSTSSRKESARFASDRNLSASV